MRYIVLALLLFGLMAPGARANFWTETNNVNDVNALAIDGTYTGVVGAVRFTAYAVDWYDDGTSAWENARDLSGLTAWLEITDTRDRDQRTFFPSVIKSATGGLVRAYVTLEAGSYEAKLLVGQGTNDLAAFPILWRPFVLEAPPAGGVTMGDVLVNPSITVTVGVAGVVIEEGAISNRVELTVDLTVTNTTVVSNELVNIYTAPDVFNNTTNLFAMTVNVSNQFGNVSVTNQNTFNNTNIFNTTVQSVVTNNVIITNIINGMAVYSTNYFITTNIFNTVINNSNVTQNLTTTNFFTFSPTNNSTFSPTLITTNIVWMTNIVTMFVTNEVTVINTNNIFVSNTFNNVQGDTHVSNYVPVTVGATVTVSGVVINNNFITETQVVDVVSTDGSIEITGTGPFDLRVTNVPPRLTVGTNGTTLGTVSNMMFSRHYAVTVDAGIAYVSNTPPAIQVTSVTDFAQAEVVPVDGLVLGIYDDGAVSQQVVTAEFNTDATAQRINLLPAPLEFVASATDGGVGRFLTDSPYDLAAAALVASNLPLHTYPVAEFVGTGTGVNSVVLTRKFARSSTNTIIAAYATEQANGGARTSMVGTNSIPEQYFHPNVPNNYGSLGYAIAGVPFHYKGGIAILRWDSSSADSSLTQAGLIVQWTDGVTAWTRYPLQTGGRGYIHALTAYLPGKTNLIYAKGPAASDTRYYSTASLPTTNVIDYILSTPFSYPTVGGPSARVTAFGSDAIGSNIICGSGSVAPAWSTNAGASWTTATFNWSYGAVPVVGVHISATNSAHMACLVAQSVFIRTTNRWASSWTNTLASLGAYGTLGAGYASEYGGNRQVIVDTGGSLLLTEDGGATWTPRVIGIPAGSYITPVFNDGIWCITYGMGAVISTNFFETWTHVPTVDRGDGAISMSALKYDKKNGIYYALYDSMLTRSVDGGATWEALLSGAGTLHTLGLTTDGRWLFVGKDNGEVLFKKYDSGTWRRLLDRTSVTANQKLLHPEGTAIRARLVTGGTNTVYAQLYEATQFSAYAAPVIYEAAVSPLDAGSATLDWFTRGIGVGLTRSHNAVASSGGRLFLAAWSGVWYSDDDGLTWRDYSDIKSYVSYVSVAQTNWRGALRVVSNVIWRGYGGVGAPVQYSPIVRRSTDQTNFSLTHRTVINYNVCSIDTIDNRTIWVAGLSNIWKSTDGGTNYSPVFTQAATRFSVATYDNTNLIAVMNPGGVRRSTDGAVTWTHLPFVTSSWETVRMYSSNLWAFANTTGRVWYTHDAGANWFEYNHVASGVMDLTTPFYNIDMDPDADTNTFYMATSRGLWKTTTGFNGTYSELGEFGNSQVDVNINDNSAGDMQVHPARDNVFHMLLSAGTLIYVSNNVWSTVGAFGAGSRYGGIHTTDGVTYYLDPGASGSAAQRSTDGGMVFSPYRETVTGNRQPVGTTEGPIPGTYMMAARAASYYPLYEYPMGFTYRTNREFFVSTQIPTINWDRIMDTMLTRVQQSDDDVYLAFGFDSTNEFRIFKSGAWRTIVSNTNNWNYYDGVLPNIYEQTYPNTFYQSLRDAFTLQTNVFTYTDVTGLTYADWPAATNITILFSVAPGNGAEAVKAFSFVADFKQGAITRENDTDYDVIITSNHTTTVTRKEAGAVDAKIYYMEVLP